MDKPKKQTAPVPPAEDYQSSVTPDPDHADYKRGSEFAQLHQQQEQLGVEVPPRFEVHDVQDHVQFAAGYGLGKFRWVTVNLERFTVCCGGPHGHVGQD